MLAWRGDKERYPSASALLCSTRLLLHWSFYRSLSVHLLAGLCIALGLPFLEFIPLMFAAHCSLLCICAEHWCAVLQGSELLAVVH